MAMFRQLSLRSWRWHIQRDGSSFEAQLGTGPIPETAGALLVFLDTKSPVINNPRFAVGPMSDIGDISSINGPPDATATGVFEEARRGMRRGNKKAARIAVL
jgi:hypothetical protein